MGVYFLHSKDSTLNVLLRHLNIAYGTQLTDAQSMKALIPWGMNAVKLETYLHDGEWVEKRDSRQPFPLVLNPPQALIKVNNKINMRALLELNGLTSPDHDHRTQETLPLYRHYMIPVFHLEGLALFQSRMDTAARVDFQAKGRSEEIGINQQSLLHKRLLFSAVRAVYCLGLDFANVELSVDSGGHLVIHGVEPAPRLNPRLGSLYAQAINRYAEELAREWSRKEPAVMGMDPEFILRQPNGRVVAASKYLDKRGQAGCDAIAYRNSRGILYALAELRPSPSCEPRQLLLNLLRTMRMAAKKIEDPELEWIAGGMPNKGFALGGHLHLSGIWLNSSLLRALDNYLALPLMMIEDASTRLRRPKYGFLGDFRRQPHGGFEYRTLPSWIVSPRATKGVLALTRLIADHYLTMKRQPLNDDIMLRHYYFGNKEPLSEIAASLWADVERLEGYSKYSGYLVPLKQQIINQIPWQEQRDIRRVWKISPYDV